MHSSSTVPTCCYEFQHAKRAGHRISSHLVKIVGTGLVVSTVLPQLKEGPRRVTLHLDGADNVSRSLTILMILLALTIAGREIPEMSKLADDPSNDGQIIDLYAEALPQPVSQRANTTKALPASKRGFVFSPPGDCSLRPALATNGQQLLLFLKIQRT